MSEYETEPIRGLPELPPEDEFIMWQGAPDAGALGRHALFGGGVAVYFFVLAAGVAISAMMRGVAAGDAVSAASRFLVPGLAVLLLLGAISWLIERTTVYTITNKRVVMRIGMALPITLNVPFSKIGSADVRVFANGTGNIALKPSGELPLNYLNLWPHARGFKFKRPEPSLICVKDARSVAGLLVEAMLAAGIEGRAKPLAPAPNSAAAQAGEPQGVAVAA